MKNKNVLGNGLYIIVGIVFLLGYYFLMTEYFKINPFKGYYLILSLYMLVSFVLFPKSGRELSEVFEKSNIGKISIPLFTFTLAFIFAPFILLFKKYNSN